jgi:hypothetical protein
LITLIIDAHPAHSGETESTIEKTSFFEICPIAGG